MNENIALESVRIYRLDFWTSFVMFSLISCGFCVDQ